MGNERNYRARVDWNRKQLLTQAACGLKAKANSIPKQPGLEMR